MRVEPGLLQRLRVIHWHRSVWLTAAQLVVCAVWFALSNVQCEAFAMITAAQCASSVWYAAVIYWHRRGPNFLDTQRTAFPSVRISKF